MEKVKHNIFKKIALFGAWLILLWAQTPSAAAQTTVHTMNFGGLTRSYRLHLPPTYTGATAVPLVFNLHGYTSNAMQQEFYSGMNAVSDTAGFILVFPDGVNNSWNSGFTPPYYSGIDDVQFISVLLDSLQAAYNIDPARVYSCGMSNGGFMSYRLACDLEQRIAAIASVTGSMTTLQLNNCAASRPMPVLEIHGTADATVPYTTTSLSMGIDSVVRFWRNTNGCTGIPQYDTLPNVNLVDFSTVTTQWYRGCNDNVEVLLYKIANGGHSWPGAVFQIPNVVTNGDILASVEIWKFFYRFIHPNPVLTGSQNIAVSRAPIVAPQPVQDVIQILQLQPDAHVTLQDLSGKQLGAWVADAAALTIDAQSLPAGMYLLRIQQSGALHSLKVLVTH
jgi:polyhydroxybutyrate depolymerase